MGYIGKNKKEIEIITKLTRDGKVKLLQNGTELIKYFRVGDSDANYLVSGMLPSGSVPSNGSENSSVVNNVKINSLINLNDTNLNYKKISEESINIISDIVIQPYKTISSVGEKIKINDNIKGNLFKSFGLPITKKKKYKSKIHNKNQMVFCL